MVGFNTSIFRRIASFCLGVVILAAQHGVAAPDLLSALPPNTLVAVQVRDAGSFFKQWDATPFARLYADPRAAAFFEPLREQFSELEARLQAKGLTFDEAKTLLTGGAVIAALPAKSDAKQPFEWLVIFEHNGDARIAGLLAETRLPAGARAESTREKIGDLELTRVRVVREVQAEIPNKAGGGAGKVSTGAIPGVAVKRQTVREHQFAIGPNIAMRKAGGGDDLAAIARRVAAGSGENASFHSRIKENKLDSLVGPDAEIEFFADIAAIAKWYEGNPKRARVPLKGDLRGLGLTDLKWLAAGLGLRDDRLAVRGSLVAPQPHAGVGQLLDAFQGQPLDAAEIVPPNALVYSSTAVHLDRAWDVMLDLLARAAPMARALLDVPLTSIQQSTGLTVRNDLLARLEPQVARFVMPGGEGPMKQSTWLARIREPQPFAAALKALLNSGSQSLGMYQVTAEENQGATIYTIAAGRPSTGYVGKPYVHLAQRGEWLTVSPSREGINASLAQLAKPSGESLKNESLFKRALGELPEERFTEAYADPSGLFPAAGELFLTGWKIPGMEDWVRSSAAPNRDVWREYFGPMAAARSRQDDGIDVQAFILYAK